MNKSQIHGELRYFLGYIQTLIKSDDELSEKLGILLIIEREIKDKSSESKITRFGSRFAEKLKSKN